jgi:hypothetical protein
MTYGLSYRQPSSVSNQNDQLFCNLDAFNPMQKKMMQFELKHYDNLDFV